MRSTINERVFRKPDGRPETLVFFGAAVAFLSIHEYYAWVLGSAGSTEVILVLAVFWALLGIIESLPEGRRQTAGILRLTMVLVVLCAIVAIVFVPEFIIG